MCRVEQWLRSRDVKLVKPVITALICAVLIGANAWLAAMSLRNDAFMTWSAEARFVVQANIAAHVLMAVSALAGLVIVKCLWGAVAGAVVKSGVAVWAIAYLGGASSVGPWGLVAFWGLVAVAIIFLINWNYSNADDHGGDHPEREFA